MLRSVIIDDEKKSRNTLSTLIERYSEGVVVCGEATCVSHGVKIINEVKPKLVFLDISMPDGSGFDLLDKFRHKDFELIFTTAYSEYAIKAIKAQAIDYLLKPINILELQNAISKVMDRAVTSAEAQSNSLRLINNNAQQKHPDTIAVSVNGGLEFLRLSDVVHLVAKGAYTTIYCRDNKVILSSHSLKEYEELLPSEYFYRTHHSHMVNLTHIKYYHRGDGGYIIMKDNTEIALSRRKKKDFLSLFQA